MRHFFMVLAGCWLLFPAWSWGLSEAEVEARLQVLFSEFRCPTCQGLSIKDSEAGFSVQMRNKIKEMLQAGDSDETIRAYFVQRYGEWILRSPPKKGFNLLLWILPGLALGVGLFFLYGKSRQWVEKHNAESQEEVPLTQEEQDLVEADLRRYERQ